MVFQYGMAQELLWRVLWALNVIGHNIVDLSDFDWLMAIKRQCLELYVQLVLDWVLVVVNVLIIFPQLQNNLVCRT